MSTETEDQLARLCERQRERIAELEAKKKDGGPAFPVIGMSQRNGQHFSSVFNGGMSFRDYFAGQALTGLIANPGWKGDLIATTRDCFNQADAILKAREQK